MTYGYCHARLSLPSTTSALTPPGVTIGAAGGSEQEVAMRRKLSAQTLRGRKVLAMVSPMKDCGSSDHHARVTARVSARTVTIVIKLSLRNRRIVRR